jgi:hypothetical protein
MACPLLRAKMLAEIFKGVSSKLISELSLGVGRWNPRPDLKDLDVSLE